MAEFTEDELKSLGIIPTNYNRTLCKRAINLALSTIQSAPKEEVIKNINLQIKLASMQTKMLDVSNIESMVEYIQPLSKTFETPAYMDDFETKVDSFEKRLPKEISEFMSNAENLSKEEIKAYCASGIFALIMCMHAKEKAHEKGIISRPECDSVLDALSDSLRITYELLLYFPSELEKVRSTISRQKGTSSRNAAFTDIHFEYFSYYEANRHRWPSNDECARQFYKTLPEEKKNYNSIEHARRQLTEAHRKFKKTNTSA